MSNTTNFYPMQEQAKGQTQSFHPQYERQQEVIELTQDCYEGQSAINRNIGSYLISSNTKSAGTLDFNAVTWAIQTKLAKNAFHNYTQRAANAALGIMFQNDVSHSGLDPKFTDNVDLMGNDLDLFAQKAMTQLMQDGSCGIYRRYLKTTNPATMRELENSNNRYYLTLIKGDQIINWETKIVDGLEVMVSVTIRYFDRYLENGSYKTEERFMESTLDSRGQAYEQDYSYNQKGNRENQGTRRPIVENGVRLNYIPFQRLTNSIEMEQPYLYNVANYDVNIFNSTARLFLSEYKTLASAFHFKTENPTKLQQDLNAQRYALGKSPITDDKTEILPLELSGTDTKEYRATLIQLKAEALEIGGIADVSTTNVQSAEALAVRFPGRNAKLALLAKKFSAAMKRSLNELNRSNGTSTPVEFTVRPNFNMPTNTTTENIVVTDGNTNQ